MIDSHAPSPDRPVAMCDAVLMLHLDLGAGEEDTEKIRCELPAGHAGYHQAIQPALAAHEHSPVSAIAEPFAFTWGLSASGDPVTIIPSLSRKPSQEHCYHTVEMTVIGKPPSWFALCCWCDKIVRPIGYRRLHGHSTPDFAPDWPGPLPANEPCPNNRSAVVTLFEAPRLAVVHAGCQLGKGDA